MKNGKLFCVGKPTWLVQRDLLWQIKLNTQATSEVMVKTEDLVNVQEYCIFEFPCVIIKILLKILEIKKTDSFEENEMICFFFLSDFLILPLPPNFPCVFIV